MSPQKALRRFYPSRRMDQLEYLDYNYSYEDNGSTVTEETFSSHKPLCLREPLCLSLVMASLLIFLLGFCGNALVIWVAGFKMRKTVNTIWYLSLAVSDFVFCAFLPFSIASTAMEAWIFGRAMCKLVPSVLFLNMFSSIFLLVIISVDRLVSVVFPVWAQNHRTIKKASVIVFLAWLLAIALSVPSVIFRDVSSHLGRTSCVNKYTSDQYSHSVVALSRLVAGFVVPFAVIIVCYSIIILKLRNNRMTKSSKPFRVMSALVAAFFLCWLPYHVFIVLELNQDNLNRDLLTVGLKVGTLTAATNSFLNPMLYVFMGNDFRQKFKSSVLSKMESAMAEDRRTSTSRYLSRTSTVDGRASTHM